MPDDYERNVADTSHNNNSSHNQSAEQVDEQPREKCAKSSNVDVLSASLNKNCDWWANWLMNKVIEDDLSLPFSLNPLDEWYAQIAELDNAQDKPFPVKHSDDDGEISGGEDAFKKHSYSNPGQLIEDKLL